MTSFHRIALILAIVLAGACKEDAAEPKADAAPARNASRSAEASEERDVFERALRKAADDLSANEDELSPAELRLALNLYRRTGDQRLISVARACAERWLEAGAWDTPDGIPLARGAEMVSALTRLYQVDPEERYAAAAAQLVARLLSRKSDDGGFVGTVPKGGEVVATAWNGLVLTALARAAFVFRRDDWMNEARELGETLRDQMVADDGGLVCARSADGAVLADYVFAVGGFIELFQVSSEREWLSLALALHHRARRMESTLPWTHEVDDSDTPSAKGMMVRNAAILHRMTLDSAWDADARERLDGPHTPSASSLMAADFIDDDAREVAIVLPADGADASALVDVLRSTFAPNIVWVRTTERRSVPMQTIVPWVRGKTAIDGVPTAYVCRNTRCELPTSDPKVFAKQLGEFREL